MRASTIGRSFPHTHNLTLALALALALTRLEHRPILPPQLVLVRARAVRIVDIPESGTGGALSLKGPEGLPLSLSGKRRDPFRSFKHPACEWDGAQTLSHVVAAF